MSHEMKPDHPLPGSPAALCPRRVLTLCHATVALLVAAGLLLAVLTSAPALHALAVALVVAASPTLLGLTVMAALFDLADWAEEVAP